MKHITWNMEHFIFCSMLHAPCSMSFNDYIEKLRAKPVREREKIAVIATGIAFVVIFLIWLISFSEMNLTASEELNNSPVEDQLEKLRQDASQSKQSIEEMMQALPNSTGLNSMPSGNPPSGEMEDQGQNTSGGRGNGTRIPQLP